MVPTLPVNARHENANTIMAAATRQIEQVDEQRDRPLGEFGELDGERHAFRRDDLAPLAPVAAQQRSRGGGGVDRAHRRAPSDRTSCR